MNCQDIWSKLYYYLAKNILSDFGVEGERGLRCGIRNFGVDRGKKLREKHVKAGLKTNLKSLFTYYDLPGDPRFRRKLIKLTEQERLSETLVCPIADVWRKYDALNIGRIYCEEFHHAMFCAYVKDAQVNLSKTLTQEGDNHCRFSVYYRPANLVKEEAEKCFFESEEKFNSTSYVTPGYREGFETLIIKLFYHISLNTIKYVGEKAVDTIKRSIVEFTRDIVTQLVESANMAGLKVTREYIEENCPITILSYVEPYNEWLEFEESLPWDIFSETFFSNFKESINDCDFE